MFYVEHRYFRSLLMALCVGFLISACKQPPENPHLSDFIYKDYKDQLGATISAIAQVDGQIKEATENIKKTHAQSPQIKYFKNKIEASIAQRGKLLQQKRYWEVKVKERQVGVTYRSLASFYSDKEVVEPPVNEQAAYQATKRLRQAKAVWNQKERVSNFEQSLKPKVAIQH